MSAEIVTQMADNLRAIEGLDLKSESACIRVLHGIGWPAGDVVTYVDAAMLEANHRGLKLSGKIADAAGLLLAGTAWALAYCHFCPPGSF